MFPHRSTTGSTSWCPTPRSRGRHWAGSSPSRSPRCATVRNACRCGRGSRTHRGGVSRPDARRPSHRAGTAPGPAAHRRLRACCRCLHERSQVLGDDSGRGHARGSGPTPWKEALAPEVDRRPNREDGELASSVTLPPRRIGEPASSAPASPPAASLPPVVEMTPPARPSPRLRRRTRRSQFPQRRPSSRRGMRLSQRPRGPGRPPALTRIVPPFTTLC